MRARGIIGTPVSITDYTEVLDAVDSAVDSDRREYICCTPASSLVAAHTDAALADALAGATIVTPDGMGVVWAARLLGEQITDRVYGPDLMELQLARAAQSSTPLFLYGGHDAAALEQLESAIAERWPGVVVAGAWSPPHRELTADEEDAVVAQINDSGAQIVWVGIGSPRQEIWMQRMRARLTAPVLVGVGAAFDFLSGRVDQAPDWMQDHGLEWLHRIFQDPLRLGRRYLLTLPRFVWLVLAQRIQGR